MSHRDANVEGGARAGLVADGEAAAESLDAVPEADQAGAAGEVGPAAAVITDTDPQHAVGDRHGDGGGGGGGVPGDVRQRLRDHVVGGDLHRVRKPAVDLDVQVNGDGAVAGQRGQRGAQPP